MEKTKKQAVMTDFALHPKDVGSADVQVAVLTTRINEMSGHMSQHPKDLGSRRGLLTMVNRRRRLLSYLKRVEPDRYQALIKRLELRH